MLYQLGCGHVADCEADPGLTAPCPEGEGPQFVTYTLFASVIDGGEDL